MPSQVVLPAPIVACGDIQPVAAPPPAQAPAAAAAPIRPAAAGGPSAALVSGLLAGLGALLAVGGYRLRRR